MENVQKLLMDRFKARATFIGTDKQDTTKNYYHIKDSNSPYFVVVDSKDMKRITALPSDLFVGPQKLSIEFKGVMYSVEPAKDHAWEDGHVKVHVTRSGTAIYYTTSPPEILVINPL